MIVIQWVQVGVCVDPQVISVRVSPVTLVPSVISVLQDIMDFQTAEVSIYLTYSTEMYCHDLLCM